MVYQVAQVIILSRFVLSLRIEISPPLWAIWTESEEAKGLGI